MIEGSSFLRKNIRRKQFLADLQPALPMPPGDTRRAAAGKSTRPREIKAAGPIAGRARTCLLYTSRCVEETAFTLTAL